MINKFINSNKNLGEYCTRVKEFLIFNSSFSIPKIKFPKWKFNFWKPFLILNFSFYITLSAAPFTDNGDGTIKDKQTGLVWQKCSVGFTDVTACSGGAASTQDWATAMTTCSGLTLAGKTWRLPSLAELSSIVDKSLATSPSINTTIFPATIANSYWSSTTYAPTTTDAWIVTFNDGTVFNSNKSFLNQVRCVSGP